MGKSGILDLWIERTNAAIDALDECLDIAARCGDEETGQMVGTLRAKGIVDLACLLAARKSVAGTTAQVRYFPEHETIALAVGEDMLVDVEDVPEVLSALLMRQARKVLEMLGYCLRDDLVVREIVHPDAFVLNSGGGAATLPN